MLNEKQIIMDALNQILLQNQFEQYRSPMRHAGGKMVWFYNSFLGQRSSLEIDINFMYRQPLYPIVKQSPKIESYHYLQAPVLDIHELAAGKLAALVERTASRDLFDAHHLMTKTTMDIKKLREIFIVYLAMTKIDLSLLIPNLIKYDLTDLKNRLLPVMHQKDLPRSIPKLKLWASKMLTELQEKLAELIPLNENEVEFICKIREEATIHPELITNDASFAGKIKTHPAIQWVVKQSRMLE